MRGKEAKKKKEKEKDEKEEEKEREKVIEGKKKAREGGLGRRGREEKRNIKKIIRRR